MTGSPTYAEGAVAFTALAVLGGQIVVTACIYHDIGITALGGMICAYALIRAAWCANIWLHSIEWRSQ